MKINKLKADDISMNLISHKFNKIDSDLLNINNMNRTISDFKLTKTNYILKKNTLKDKITKPNKNKKTKFEMGDSYEFNFTFNNFNNNFTQNNINGNYFKTSDKKRKKINSEKEANKTIINDFTLVRNNIINDIKNIINNNNKKKKDLESQNAGLKSKINKIGVIRKNKKKNKDIYAIKIQKVFRGYIFRKIFIFDKRKNPNEKVNSNNKIYIKKKIINKKISLNVNKNDNLINYQKEKDLPDYNLVESKIKDNTINNTICQENKIEEIIIDKNKLVSVLGPIKKRNEISEIIVNFNDNL